MVIIFTNNLNLRVNNNNGGLMKKILITGARSGIGYATIKKLLNKNYEIYLTVHTEGQQKVLKEKYKNYKNVYCFKLDVTNKQDLKKLEQLDIDILFCNAAIGYSGSIAEIPINLVRENFEVNVFSNFQVVQIIIEKMLQKNSGKIIMMSSIARLIPNKFLGVYSATKASISNLTYSLKKELKFLKSNIKTILIEPGAYHTGFNQVILENKYDWMNNNSYFKEHLELIRTKEFKYFNMIERKNLNSITNQIVRAIESDNPKFIYRAPFSQAITAKIINFIIF